MNGIDYVADTNALIYILSGNDCMESFLHKNLALSIINYLELLSFPELTDEEENVIKSFLESCKIIQINERIIECTIQLRRKYRLKLPDSIIASTAIVFDLPLITADTGFLKIEELQVIKVVL